MIYCVIECKNKVYSKSGCYCCWHCDVCGKMGCDNLVGLNENSTIERVGCEIGKDND